ncbi:hypothetical protein ACF08O_31725 [Streptomyces paradoxus]|uniref:hypothetical protein n=1 Tax=Streptomyces paradoxus TaxID=66375 RepID=UPI0036FB2EF0
MTHAAAVLVGIFFGVMIGIIGSGGSNNDSPTTVRTVTAPPTAVEQSEKGGTTSPSRPQAQKSGGIPGDGVFLVGDEVMPGTYRSDGKDRDLCYWARLSDTTGQTDDIIASGNAEGQTIVKIVASDEAFQSSDCKPWKKID